MTAFHNIINLFYYFIFIIRNIFYLLYLKNITEAIDDNFFICGARSIKDLKDVLNIYSLFHNNKKIDISKRITYHFLYKKCVFTVRDINTSMIIGIGLYYKNKRDIIENTIHEGFTGILPEWQGKKIGTILRLHAINHFKRNGMNGISSRVSLNNYPSLKSNINLGFRPVDKYFDKDLNEERYYLICPLSNNYSWDFIEINTHVK
ncbi:hypothetical protein R84B8_02115 [Treponema sp. R8-4-B8]